MNGKGGVAVEGEMNGRNVYMVGINTYILHHAIEGELGRILDRHEHKA